MIRHRTDGTIEITMHAPPCRICGAIDLRNSAVLHAVGYYCPAHAFSVAVEAQRRSDDQIRKMMASGIISLPTKNYDPLEHCENADKHTPNTNGSSENGETQ